MLLMCQYTRRAFPNPLSLSRFGNEWQNDSGAIVGRAEFEVPGSDPSAYISIYYAQGLDVAAIGGRPTRVVRKVARSWPARMISRANKSAATSRSGTCATVSAHAGASGEILGLAGKGEALGLHARLVNRPAPSRSKRRSRTAASRCRRRNSRAGEQAGECADEKSTPRPTHPLSPSLRRGSRC